MNNMTKTNSVLKTFVIAGVFAAGIATTTSANAEAVSLETAIAQTIAAQGQRLATEVTHKLQSTIQQEVDTFSIDAAWQWFYNDQANQETVVQQNEAQSTNQTTNNLKDKA